MHLCCILQPGCVPACCCLRRDLALKVCACIAAPVGRGAEEHVLLIGTVHALALYDLSLCLCVVAHMQLVGVGEDSNCAGAGRCATAAALQYRRGPLIHM